MKVFKRLLLRDIKRLSLILIGKGEPYSWEKFHRKYRMSNSRLLKKIDHYPDVIMVGGCQRSGTTVLARVISESENMVSHQINRDDELDGARILAGDMASAVTGRHCFQTTYLNENYHEYLHIKVNYRLIWVLRNPYSVVYSMHYNWGRFSFNELFDACGYTELPDQLRTKYDKYGKIAIPRYIRACYSYKGKVKQALLLYEKLGSDRMMVVDYDQLVQEKDTLLKHIYDFIDLDYKQEYGTKIHGKSISKSSLLSEKEKKAIDRICMPVYREVSELISA